eukprot:TRINITY_DN57318_c0_g1_i1.p1 TRINITY_DN57318_c0_g1~~TRINITY_DN57318_c0_g1_i1.p1  ORF type:complete len:355 (-),score=51.76 TRINITY_DN57318_c0_g1_i1:42-1106(-)
MVMPATANYFACVVCTVSVCSLVIGDRDDFMLSMYLLVLAAFGALVGLPIARRDGTLRVRWWRCCWARRSHAKSVSIDGCTKASVESITTLLAQDDAKSMMRLRVSQDAGAGRYSDKREACCKTRSIAVVSTIELEGPSSSSPSTISPASSASSGKSDAEPLNSVRGGCPPVRDANDSPESVHELQHTELAHCFSKLVVTDVDDEEIFSAAFRSVSFLRSCGYALEDIASCLAHTSVYLNSFSYLSFGSCEIGRIVIVLMFIAHSYVLDDHCPISSWHQHLLSDYCEKSDLDKAVFSLMKLRDYKLGIAEDEGNSRYQQLITSVEHTTDDADDACHGIVIAATSGKSRPLRLWQ